MTPILHVEDNGVADIDQEYADPDAVDVLNIPLLILYFYYSL